MKPRRVLRCVVPLAAALLALGCGTGEWGPSPAEDGVPAPTTSSQAMGDADDTTVTALRLSTSVEYDSDQNQVRIFALVKDQNGADFTSLNEHNFVVRLIPKSAARPVPPEETVLSSAVVGDRVIALVIDSSGSMGSVTETGESRMTVAKEAARLFVDLMSSTDRTALVDFDDAARIVEPLTGDGDALKAEIGRLTDDGLTNLGGALTEAVRAVGATPGRRAVIFLTDGDDTVDPVQGGPSAWLNDPNSSRFQALALAKENNLAVYTVGLGGDLTESGLADLQTFASETGGRFFQAPTAAALLTAFGQTIPDEVNSQPPQETLVLSFENPIPRIPGRETDVDLNVVVSYENALGPLRDTFDGTYTVK